MDVPLPSGPLREEGEPARSRPHRAGVAPPDGATRSAISQALVRIHADHYGKGATHAKTYAYDNVVVAVLRQVLTTAEHTLVDGGREDAVIAVRQAFKQAKRRAFVTAVEQLTERRVVSFLSQVDPRADVEVDVFLLESDVPPAPDIAAAPGEPPPPAV